MHAYGDGVPILDRRGRHQVEDLPQALRRGGDHVQVALIETRIVLVDGQFEFPDQIHPGHPVDRIHRRGRADPLQRLLRLGDGPLVSCRRVIGVLTLPPRPAQIHPVFGEQIQFGVDPLLGDGVDRGGLADLTVRIGNGHLPSLGPAGCAGQNAARPTPLSVTAGRRRSMRRGIPVLAGAQLHFQGDGEFGSRAHPIRHDRG